MQPNLRERAEELEQQPTRTVETHISLVYLGARSVLKVKKPVDLGFVDFRTAEARRVACEAEVRLNRRLAPSVYLGVVPVVPRRQSSGHRVAREGEASSDWGVLMRRLPDSDSFQARLGRAALETSHLDGLAELLARFHEEAALVRRADATRVGDPSFIEANVRENFSQAHELLSGLTSESQMREVEEYQLSWLRDHAETLQRRIDSNRIVEGHGDLKLEHVYADDAGHLLVIDCIEFSERFRLGDACSDVAFLAMDLNFQSRSNLAEIFLARYAEASGDFDLYSVVDFYQSYRSYVRAKICALTATTTASERRQHDALLSAARRFLLLSQASEKPPLRRASLVAVGGLIASGKSTVATTLGRQFGLPVVSSDRTRKRLHDVSPVTELGSEPFAGAYAATETERVYREMLRAAAEPLASSRSVVLDASFSSRSWRKAARALAQRYGARFRFIECHVPEEVARRRLRRRAQQPSISDGREALYDSFAARYEPVDDLPSHEHVRLDTSRSTTRLPRDCTDWLSL